MKLILILLLTSFAFADSKSDEQALAQAKIAWLEQKLALTEQKLALVQAYMQTQAQLEAHEAKQPRPQEKKQPEKK